MELTLSGSRRWRTKATGVLAKSWSLAKWKPLGAAIFALMIVLAVLSPQIATHAPNKQNADDRLLAPSAEYWMGTDDAGRDVWSRVVYGARVSLYVGVVSVILASVAGTAVGMTSAYVGGRTDTIMQRIVEVFLAFPTLILALVIIAMLGASVNNLVIAVVLAFSGVSRGWSAGALWQPRRSRILMLPGRLEPGTCG